MTFIAFTQRFNQPISQISAMWTNVQSAVAGGERIFGLLDTVPDLQDAPDAIEMPPIQGRVVFDDVWAEYEPGQPVLRDVNLVARAGSDDRHRRADRRGQDDDRQPDPALLRRQRRVRHHRRRRRADTSPRAACGRRSASCCRIPSCSATAC